MRLLDNAHKHDEAAKVAHRHLETCGTSSSPAFHYLIAKGGACSGSRREALVSLETVSLGRVDELKVPLANLTVISTGSVSHIIRGQFTSNHGT